MDAYGRQAPEVPIGFRMVMRSPALQERWRQPARDEIAQHFERGSLMEMSLEQVKRQWGQYELLEWDISCQVKRNKETGAHLKDKARLVARGDLEILIGMFPERSVLYSPTLKSATHKYLVAICAHERRIPSISDVNSAFQTVPSIRDVPVVIQLPDWLTGAGGKRHYVLMSMLQGMPDASKAFYDHLMPVLTACGLNISRADACLLTWQGPPTEDPAERGSLRLGIVVDDISEYRGDNKASWDKLLQVRTAVVEAGMAIKCQERPSQAIGVAMEYGANGTITMKPTQQLMDLWALAYPGGPSTIPRRLTPMRADWSATENDKSPVADATRHRKGAGLIVYAGTTKFELNVSAVRICSRAHKHTEADWENIQWVAAYTYWTRDVGPTYWPAGAHDSPCPVLVAATDAAGPTFADGRQQAGMVIKAGGGIRGPSAAVMAHSYKDKGVAALTVPDGEMKSLSYGVHHVLNMRTIAEDCHNEQPPTQMDQDNQAVKLACRLCGNDKAFIHRRAMLTEIASAIQAGYIEIVTVAAAEQVADIQTKALPPLQHWRALAWLMGRSPALTACQTVVFDRWLKEPQETSREDRQAQEAREEYTQLAVWKGSRPGARLEPGRRQALMAQIPYDKMEEDLDRICDDMGGGGRALSQLEGDLKLAVNNAAQLEQLSPFADPRSEASRALTRELNSNIPRQQAGAVRREQLVAEKARRKAEQPAQDAYRATTAAATTAPRLPLYQQFVRQKEASDGERREQEIRTALLKRKQADSAMQQRADQQGQGPGTQRNDTGSGDGGSTTGGSTAAGATQQGRNIPTNRGKTKAQRRIFKAKKRRNGTASSSRLIPNTTPTPDRFQEAGPQNGSLQGLDGHSRQLRS